MISIVLMILGITFLYGGMLMLPQDSTAGVACALIGVLLIIKPLATLLQQLRGSARGRDRAAGRKPPKKRRHLRVVKPPKDDQPTIH